MPHEEVDRMRARAVSLIDQAVAFADASPEPRLTTILEGVYA
jgi:TPP-dependent pyruvate/acetoin dehydrogenase alpha subunit